MIPAREKQVGQGVTRAKRGYVFYTGATEDAARRRFAAAGARGPSGRGH